MSTHDSPFPLDWNTINLEPSQASVGLKTRRKPNPDEDQSDSTQRKRVTILFYGENRELALYRADYLQNLGYTMILPQSKDRAIAAIRHLPFDAAILSYTLSSETVKELADLIRQTCPKCPLLTISKLAVDDPHVGPDAIIRAEDGPRVRVGFARGT